MELQSFEYHDPARLIREVADRVPLTANTVYLVLVAHPSTEQRIVLIQRMDQPARLGGSTRGDTRTTCNPRTPANCCWSPNTDGSTC